MRFIISILRINDCPKDFLMKCLQANFHSALDAKYSVYNGLLWSTFMHPLKSLTKEFAYNAMLQTIELANNTGGWVMECSGLKAHTENDLVMATKTLVCHFFQLKLMHLSRVRVWTAQWRKKKDAAREWLIKYTSYSRGDCGMYILTLYSTVPNGKKQRCQMKKSML